MGVNENVQYSVCVLVKLIYKCFRHSEIIIDGNTNAAYASGASLYMGAGDFGPSSGVIPMRMEGPNNYRNAHRRLGNPN